MRAGKGKRMDKNIAVVPLEKAYRLINHRPTTPCAACTTSVARGLFKTIVAVIAPCSVNA